MTKRVTKKKIVLKSKTNSIFTLFRQQLLEPSFDSFRVNYFALFKLNCVTKWTENKKLEKTKRGFN